MPAPSSKKQEHQMHAPSKKVLSSGELETLRMSRNPTTVVTAIGEMQSNEEARVHVYDLYLFVTVQLLEGTPGVLSLGKLCEEHGCSNEWTSGQKPQLTKSGTRVVLGLTSSSSASSSSTSFPQDPPRTSSSPAKVRSDDTYYQPSGDRGDHPQIKKQK